MSLSDRIGIPNQKESADWKNADKGSLPTTQYTCLENNLEPE